MGKPIEYTEVCKYCGETYTVGYLERYDDRVDEYSYSEMKYHSVPTDCIKQLKKLIDQCVPFVLKKIDVEREQHKE